MTKKYKVASLFAGIGGIDEGFNKAGFETIWANEIDKNCEEIYKLNHPKTKLVIEDISFIKSGMIPKVDIIVGGFPCQPFSVAGFRKGFDDDRGDLFFQIIRIIKESIALSKTPKVIFLENVKNLFTHDDGNTYAFMKKQLENMGYFVKEKILNSCEYGNIPQNRERLYIIAFKNKEIYSAFEWPNKIELTNTLDKVIDFNNPVEKKFYYNESHKPYMIMKEGMTKSETVYQFRRVYMRENKSNLSPTLTANMGMGGHNVPLILDKNKNIRKLTPRETFMLQGFDKDFIIPKSLSNSKLYKMAGNSVTVTVIQRLAEKIRESLKKNENTNKIN